MTSPSPRPTREQVDAIPHKAAALLLAAARPDPALRTAAMQVQDALIALDDEVRALRAEQQSVYDGLAERLHDALTAAGVSCDDDGWPDGLCWHVVRAALAARTPRSAETVRVGDPCPWDGPDGVHEAGGGRDRDECRYCDGTIAAAPLPAVPDGEEKAAFALPTTTAQTDRKIAIVELRGLTACRCDAAWRDRGLHESMRGCASEYREDVDLLAAAASLDGEDVPARLDAASELAAFRAQRDAVLAIADDLDRQAPSRPSAPVLAARLRTALGVDCA